MIQDDDRVLRVGHGNGHNELSLVAYVRSADADSFGANEAQRLVGRLDDVPGHRVVCASKDAQDRRARSTVMVTRSALPDVGSLVRQVSESIPGAVNKFAPDRMLVASYYEHPIARACGKEGVAHFALHPDATVMHRQPDHPLVREYRESMTSARQWMRAADLDDLLVILTGDLQVNARFKAAWGPREQIQRPLGMQARVVGIDWIMYPPVIVPAGPVKKHKLFDHTGFTQDFRPRAVR